MTQRLASIYFPSLIADWTIRRQPALRSLPFVLVTTERGRRVVTAANALAQSMGVRAGMVLADCQALVPELQVLDDEPRRPEQLLNALAEWCVRYTPSVSVDLPAGLILDVSGCTHLWGGEAGYLRDLESRLTAFGYVVRTAMADTIGTAWAISRFGASSTIVEPGAQKAALTSLPPAALRLEAPITEKLHKLGLNHIGSFIDMPRTALRRRFGQALLSRLDQALGMELELPELIRPLVPYREQLPSMEPIRTAPGIEIALKTLLEGLCERLSRESKGIRKCELRCYRIDGNVQKIDIGTNRPSRNVVHLFKLFEPRIAEIEPDLGIELFILEAPVVEDLLHSQDALWSVSNANETAVAELLDRLAGKVGSTSIHRYLPAEHYWPERSFTEAETLAEKAVTAWPNSLPRPLHLLPIPEEITVSVPIPDYPPMLFRYKGKLHQVKKAEGPERIEQEWWLQQGLYRDYYQVEDEHGARYWLFRSGDYDNHEVKWFMHGFFV